MTPPGMVLSQPTRTISASNRLPRVTSSMESAITSRLIREARMPSVPMVMPSEMEIVLNSSEVAAGGANAVTHVRGEFAQMVIAGADFDPGVGDADQRFAKVVIFQSGGTQHGARRSAMSSIGQCRTARLHGLSVTTRLLRESNKSQ